MIHRFPGTRMRRRATFGTALLALATLTSPANAVPAQKDSPIGQPVVALIGAPTDVSAGAPTDVPAGAPTDVPAAAPTDATIALSLRASGLSSPVYVTSAHDGTGRMFIVEQTGRIKILDGGTVRSTPFLNLSGQVAQGGEEGLLSLAFHPNFKSNRKLYVYMTAKSGNNIIREYRASSSNPNVVDTSTKRQVMWISHPVESNHNGGMIAFGHDDMLYIGTGDGGGAGDHYNRAQNKERFLGKMLRINVDTRWNGRGYGLGPGNPYIGKPGLNEIWQIGLRNPWRWSFDRATGDLWIGDVGQGEREEIDRAKRTSTGPGRGVNWGWRVMEGDHCYQPSSGCNTSGKARPITEYNHSGSRCAVSGGYVYRGSAIPALVGGYVFADYCSGEVWVVNANASPGTDPTLLLDTSLNISGFGENASGELLVTDLGGRVYAIVQG